MLYKRNFKILINCSICDIRKILDFFFFMYYIYIGNVWNIGNWIY